MSVDIKLDTNALKALFPEGTEARVNLQSAVIQNYAKPILKGCTDRITQEVLSELRLSLETGKLRKEILEQAKEEIAVFWTASGGYSPVYQLTEAGKEKIAALVSEQVDVMFRAAVNEKLRTFTEKTDALLNSYASRMTDQELEARLDSKLEARVTEFIKQMLDKKG